MEFAALPEGLAALIPEENFKASLKPGPFGTEGIGRPLRKLMGGVAPVVLFAPVDEIRGRKGLAALIPGWGTSKPLSCGLRETRRCPFCFVRAGEWNSPRCQNQKGP